MFIFCLNFSLSDFFEMDIDADPVSVEQFEKDLSTRTHILEMFPTATLTRSSIKNIMAMVESRKIEGKARVLAELAAINNYTSKGFGGVQLMHVAKYSGKARWLKDQKVASKILRRAVWPY